MANKKRNSKSKPNPPTTTTTGASLTGADSAAVDPKNLPKPSSSDSAPDPSTIGDVAEASMDAVVKVFCVHCEPNYSLPWQMKRQINTVSSGFVIGGKRVLTTAHSVYHHTQVKVKKRGKEEKYVARVLAIGIECDIGVLV